MEIDDYTVLALALWQLLLIHRIFLSLPSKPVFKKAA